MIDRRSFLRAMAVGAAGLALPACQRGPRPGLSVFLGAGEFVAGRMNRVPLGLVDPDGERMGRVDGRAWIGRTGKEEGPVPLVYRRFARPRTGDAEGFHVVELPIARPEILTVYVEAGGLAGEAALQARAEPTVPARGAPAVRTQTPTVERSRGVASICTRTPRCPLHERSLDVLLGERLPLVVMIGSPALCPSRTCGPVLEEVLIVRERYGMRAAFLHIEPYRGRTATHLSPAAQAWRIESEPWTFVIDSGGVVRERFEGPVTAEEIEPSLAAHL